MQYAFEILAEKNVLWKAYDKVLKYYISKYQRFLCCDPSS